MGHVSRFIILYMLPPSFQSWIDRELQRLDELKKTRLSPQGLRGGRAGTPIQPIQTKNSIIYNYEEFPLRNRNAVYTLLIQEEDPEGTGHRKDDSWLRI